MNIVVYGMETQEDAIIAYGNCMIKPCIGECMEINDCIYEVRQVCTSYGKNTVYVFVDDVDKFKNSRIKKRKGFIK